MYVNSMNIFTVVFIASVVFVVVVFVKVFFVMALIQNSMNTIFNQRPQNIIVFNKPS